MNTCICIFWVQIRNYTADEGKRLQRISACTGVPYFRLTLLATLVILVADDASFWSNYLRLLTITPSFLCTLKDLFCFARSTTSHTDQSSHTCRSIWKHIQDHSVTTGYNWFEKYSGWITAQKYVGISDLERAASQSFNVFCSSGFNDWSKALAKKLALTSIVCQKTTMKQKLHMAITWR